MTYKQLTPGQRYAIAAMLRRGHSQKEIAETVGVSPATICCEVRRNSTARTYSPRAAQEMADIRKERLRRNRVVPDWVWARVRARWSPEQVSGALRAEGVRVSHQAHLRHDTRRQDAGRDGIESSPDGMEVAAVAEGGGVVGQGGEVDIDGDHAPLVP